jgi:hypothetical protein
VEAKARLQREIAETRKTHERELKLFEARRKAEEEQKRRAQELEDKAKEQRRQLAARVEDALAKAYLAIGQGDLGKAGKMIAEAAKIDANHPGLPRAQADLQAAQNLATQEVAAQPRLDARPFPVKAVAIGAGAAVALMAGTFLLLHKPPAPTLDVSPRSANISTNSASISLTGAGPFQAKSREAWINVAPDSGTLPSTIVLSANSGNLAAGTYTGSVEISSGELNKPIAVNLTIEAKVPRPVEKDPEPETIKPPATPQPEISLSPESLNITYQAGSPEPAPRSIFADGKGHFQASARNGQWVSVSPASGNLPGPLSVAIHPGQLPPGSYATQVVVVSSDAPAVKKFANIHLTVTEAPKPVAKPPVDVPVTPTPPPQPVEPQKCSTEAYLGRRLGDLVWNGSLAPNGKVVIVPTGAIQGGGGVVGNAIPRMACFDVSNLPPGVRASTGASTLTLTNVSGAPLTSITVHWAVK